MSDTKDKNTGKYCYEYPRAALTSDCVIFGFDGDRLQLLLIERGVQPFKGFWALPGGFMKMDESIEQCALRELREETSISDLYLEQFKMFSSPGRDPRGRVVTMAFIALVRPSDYKIAAGDDASLACWFDVDTLPPLAFDHLEIVKEARLHLQEILRLRPVAFRLLDEIFSADELRKVYEAVNGISYDRRNFTRKLLQSGIVEDVSPEYPQKNMAEAYHSCVQEPNSSYDDSQADTRERKRQNSGRGKQRLFSLNESFISKIMRKAESAATHDDETSSDASIKDLFNF